jgi:uncharacterized protein involved in oxidation of intracellular sulfur
MKIGITISTKDAETAWNAVRLANFSIKEGDEAQIFLIGQGVEAQSITTDPFNVHEEIEAFIDNGGKILACGTCMEMREQQETKTCPLSTLRDLYELIRESDKIITF